MQTRNRSEALEGGSKASRRIQQRRMLGYSSGGRFWSCRPFPVGQSSYPVTTFATTFFWRPSRLYSALSRTLTAALGIRRLLHLPAKCYQNLRFRFSPHPGVIGIFPGEEYQPVLFEDQALRDVLGRTNNPIELRNEAGICCRLVCAQEALMFDLGLFVGIGNRRRVRFLRARTQRFSLNAGSHTTRRLTDSEGRNISHPLIREHRQQQQL
jgi:hypothetical protein